MLLQYPPMPPGLNPSTDSTGSFVRSLARINHNTHDQQANSHSPKINNRNHGHETYTTLSARPRVNMPAPTCLRFALAYPCYCSAARGTRAPPARKLAACLRAAILPILALRKLWVRRSRIAINLEVL